MTKPGLLKRVDRAAHTRWTARFAKGVRSGAELQRFADACRADVVSIDLFDTIVFRRCATPATVFVLQYAAIASHIPQVGDAAGWKAIRQEAERRLSEAHPDREIDIQEIYDAIGSQLGLDPDTIARMIMAEIAIERSVIRPYPDVAQALQACQGSGKTIVVTTDTYLPRTFIQEILDGILPCSFTLYCSSERGNTKRHGTAFKDLVTMFPGQRIVHFGDNARSDVTMARGHGITPCLVRWQRPDFLARNARYLRYGASQGALTLDTPYDRPSPDTPSERAQREIAWRWAIVLADFVKQAHRYAQDVGAQEIWLLSRDCESIHDVLASGTAPAGAIPTRYVHTSRAATYPILAHSDETVFARWRNRPATDDDRRAGKDLIAAYQAMVEPAVERILIVDIGWKGRVQIAIQTALPDVEVFGFYMSLSDEAEPATRARSRVFCGWDRTILNQAGAEALSGYRQGSCTGYRATQNGWAPVFKDAEGDVAPAAYCESLRQHLGDFLAQSAGSDDEALRRDALADILTRPDAITARAFETWGIGAEISSDPTGSLVAGGKTDLVSRALGREIRDNVWPELAMWSLSRHPLAVTLLQKQMRARKRLQQK